MGIIEQLTPTHYFPQRIAFERDGEGGIVATADFPIYNINGRRVGTDHPAVTLTPGELSTFLAWYNAKAAAYETATGLELYVPPVPAEGPVE